MWQDLWSQMISLSSCFIAKPPVQILQSLSKMGGNPTIVFPLRRGSCSTEPWWEGIQPLFSCHATHPQRSSWSWVQAVAGILRVSYTGPWLTKQKKNIPKTYLLPKTIVSETGIPTHKNWTSTWKMEELYQLHPVPPSIDGAMGWSNRLGWSCFCCTKCWMIKSNLQEMRSTIWVSVYSMLSVYCDTIWFYI